ncbi:hypothetical protein SZN_34762, partial [Streptomyces zinciresistens K42]
MALFKKRTVGKPGEWYYCLVHKKVEEGPDCPAKDRFGPYGSREEAQHAMDLARERNQEWENDPAGTTPGAGGTRPDHRAGAAAGPGPCCRRARSGPWR